MGRDCGFNHSKPKIGYLIRRMNKTFKNRIMYQGIKDGLDEVTLMHAWIMGYLHRNEIEGHEIFQRDLESHFGLSRSSVTSIVQMMEKKDYIIRESVPNDARLKKIRLTDTGRETSNRVKDTLDRIELDIEKDLDPRELEIFIKIALKIIDNLEKC